MSVKKLLSAIWRFINNGIVLTIAGFVLSIIYVQQQQLFDSFLSVVFANLFKYVNYFLTPLFAVCSLVIAINTVRWIRSLFKIRFKDESVLLGFSPTAKLLSYFRSRRLNIFEVNSTLKRFSTYANEYYYRITKVEELKSDLFEGYNDSRSISIIHTIPARRHLSFPDFLDLRCLKQLSNIGVDIRVIIMDVPYLETHHNEIDMEIKYGATSAFINTMLYGRHVYRLSKILDTKRDRQNVIIKYILTSCIPLFAQKNSNASGQSVINNISFFSFPFILKALDLVANRGYCTYTIVWKERIPKWTEYDEFRRNNLPNLRLSGLIVGETFLDYECKKLKTSYEQYSDHSFNVTDSLEAIAVKLMSGNDDRWTIPDSYIEYLGRTCLGFNLHAHYSKKKKRNIFSDRVMQFAEHYSDNSRYTWTEEFEAIAKRYLLYKEIARVQRKLLHQWQK